jgi:hypothetical protein
LTAKVTISKNVFVTMIVATDGLYHGYRVLRFTNDDVMKNLEGVLLAIQQAAEQAAPLSLTLPRKGGGNPSAGASLTDANQTEEKS